MHDLRWPESEPHVTLIRRDCINRFVNWKMENFLESLLVVGICNEFCVIYYVLLGTTENLDLAPSLAHHNAPAQHMGLYFTANRGARLVNGIR